MATQPAPTRRRPILGPVTGIVAALTLMVLSQAAQSDWIMVVVLLCTIGFLIFREKEYRR